MDLKGSKTEKNLMASLPVNPRPGTGTPTLRARQEKMDLSRSPLALRRLPTGKEHAKRFFKFLQGGEVEIHLCLSCGRDRSTLENLKAAAAGSIITVQSSIQPLPRSPGRRVSRP